MAESYSCEGCCYAAAAHLPVKPRLSYDEVTQERDNNFLSIKVPKNVKQVEKIQENTDTNFAMKDSVRTICYNSKGKKCGTGCAKVNIITNHHPPTKQAEEGMFLLKATKQMTNTDFKNNLEIEFKVPRNYIPLPDLGPAPPPIQIVSKMGVKGKGKGSKKATTTTAKQKKKK